MVTVSRHHEFCAGRERKRTILLTKSLLSLLRQKTSAFAVSPLWQNLQCGESVTIEGQTYTISAVTHRYQLRKGKYEPSEKRLDVLSTGRYLLNLYLETLLQQS
ncbi:hypothetical protein SASPL_147094 [Salvia splendens]|uniref:Uncharacterized protein n=1 Tax=Salvia splendens TaxID=180675 RepID=A0A8X8WF60_SALSN|nr:hypothetical protein SASPL_147094 [Salvia splendens]